MDKKALTTNGWIASVLLLAITFLFYYSSFIYPEFVSQDQEMYFRVVKVADENARLQIYAFVPKYLADFQEGLITLNFACQPNDSDCAGSLLLVSYLVEDETENNQSPVTLKRLDIKDNPSVARNLSIPYRMKDIDVLSIPIAVQIPSRLDGNEVVFKIYIIAEQEKQEEETITEVTWGGDTTCSNQSLTRICAEINATKPFKQGALKFLLFPPWSNRLIPFIVFTMVWLAEQVLPNKKAWDEQPNAWLLCLAALGAYFLFLFYAVLYLYLLTDQSLVALFYAALLIFYIITLPKLFSRGDK